MVEDEGYYGIIEKPFGDYEEGDPIYLPHTKKNKITWTKLLGRGNLRPMTQEEKEALGEHPENLHQKRKEERQAKAEKQRIKEEILVHLLRKEKKAAIHETAKHLLKKLHLLTLDDTEEILHYNRGTYHTGGETKVKKEIQELWLDQANKYAVSEILGHIQRSSYTPRAEFHQNPNKICLRNGILDIETHQLTPHNPKQKFLWELPIEYNPQAECPQIEKFIREIVYEQEIPTIYELIGYCIYPRYHIQKAFMFTGGGANGKTTLLNLIKKFLGKENTTGLSLQEIEDNPYAKGYLHGKLANIYPDLKTKALKQTGTFKMLTGGDTISSDRKFKDRIEFTNYAKLIFSANQLPTAYDDTDAFYRRWVILSFPNTFPEDKRDTKLLEKLTTPEELSGLLNKALEGLRQLNERGDFTTTRSTEEWREEYIRLSDPVKAYIMDCLEPDPSSSIPKETLYGVFIEYCKEKKLPVKTNNMFTREVKQYISPYSEAKMNTPEGRKKTVVGWAFKGDVEKTIPNVHHVPLFLYCGPWKNVEGTIEKNRDVWDREDNVKIQHFFEVNKDEGGD